MSRLPALSPKSPRIKIKKLEPLQDLSKHVRSPRTYRALQSPKPAFFSTRLCSSYSPRVQLADAYLEEIDHLCENTRKNIECAKNSVITLSLKLGKARLYPDDFQERREDLISQCQEFVNDRKFTLKTQQEFLVTKKLQRTVTKKMLGE